MKLNAALVTIALALIGWLVTVIGAMSRLTTMQEYQEKTLTEIKVSLEKIQARIDYHIDQQQGPVRPR